MARLTRVRSYRRKDGTAVSGHSRTVATRPQSDLSSGLKGALTQQVAEPTEMPRQVTPADVYGNRRLRRALLEGVNEDFWYLRDVGVVGSSASFGALTAGVGVTAIIGGAALFGVALIALPIAAGMVPVARMLAARRRAVKEVGDVKATVSDEYAQLAADAVRRHPRWAPSRHLPFSGEKAYRDPHAYPKYEATSMVDAAGLAHVNWADKDGRGTDTSGTLLLHPEVRLSNTVLPFPVLTPGVNLQKANLSSSEFSDGVNWEDADLREANLHRSMVTGSFRGANLRDADLSGADLSGVDLTGADLTGANLSGMRPPRDLTGVTLTAEQYDSLDHNSRYDRCRVRELDYDTAAAALTGGDRDALTVSIWAGDVELRDRVTGQVVTGGYDPEKHFIPHWVAEPTTTV
jgi:hypothetical protein